MKTIFASMKLAIGLVVLLNILLLGMLASAFIVTVAKKKTGINHLLGARLYYISNKHQIRKKKQDKSQTNMNHSCLFYFFLFFFFFLFFALFCFVLFLNRFNKWTKHSNTRNMYIIFNRNRLFR